MMEDGDPIEPASHVTKLVKNSKVYKSAEGNIVDGTELIPRPSEEYMSVNWLEYDGDMDIDVCLMKIMAIYEKKFTVTNHRLPVINVKKAIDYVKAESPDKRSIQFLYKPEFKPESKWDDPSHSGVYGYSHSHEDALIGDLIAQVVESLHTAKDYK